MANPKFVQMYNPNLAGNPRVSVSFSSVDDHAARGWLLVDGETPAPTSTYLTSADGDARYFKTADIPTSTELKAASVAAVLVDSKVRARLGRLTALGSPIVSSRCQTHLSTGSGAVGTSRMRHVIRGGAGEVRLVYSNWIQVNNGYGGDADPAGPITFSAAVELPGDKIFPVTFGGKRSVTLDAGMVVSDPLGVSLQDGDVLWSRTYLSAGSPAAIAASEDTNGEGFTETADLTAFGAAAVATAFRFIYGPAAVIGASAEQRTVVGIAGDSIGFGQGDSIGAGRNHGSIVRALDAAGLPYWQAAMSGEFAEAVNLVGQFRYRLPILLDCSAIVCEYGRNDVSGNRPLAVIQESLIATWRQLGASGARIWQTTITPKSTSTDAWATTTNQATDTTNAVRVQVNTWLRDGAPINSSDAAVATGTTGTRAGAPGHPLTGWFEAADYVETTRGSGIWKAGYTDDGTHPLGVAHTAMAAGIDTAVLAA